MKNDENAAKTATKEDSQTKSADFLSAGEAGSYENLELNLQGLLKAGAHFGHKTSRRNPKMKEYIFGERNGVNIINLEKTLDEFQKALEFLKGVAANGGKILFVGTKPQARELVKKIASDLDMPSVSNRWLGGTFTNFNEIKRRIKHLNEQENLEAGEEIKKYTKYERSRIRKEIARMNEKMGGIKKVDKLPQAVFLIDIKDNELAVKEAKKAGIPTVALTDTNTDPTLVDYPIPANDDALSSLKYILGITAKTVAEAKNMTGDKKAEK